MESGAENTEDVRRFPRRLAGFSSPVAKINGALKKFLYRRLYDHPTIVEERDRSVDALERLFRYYLAHPETIPPYYAELALERAPSPRRLRLHRRNDRSFPARQHQELLGEKLMGESTVGAARRYSDSR